MEAVDAAPDDLNTIPAPIGEKALQAAADAVKVAAATEETRFSNLNVRAINLISAGSVVIALIAVFGKDLVTGDGTVPQKSWMTGLLIVTAVGLFVAIAILVVAVLLPGGRYTFGDNRVTNSDPPVTEPSEVYEVQWREYRVILKRLTERNMSKARGLHAAYWFYAAAVAAAAAAVVLAFSADL